MMDELCEAPTPTGYHSSDMVTLSTCNATLVEGGRCAGRLTDSGVCVYGHSVKHQSTGMYADERATVLCGYHELRRLMRQNASQRAQRATAGSVGWCPSE